MFKGKNAMFTCRLFSSLPLLLLLATALNVQGMAQDVTVEFDRKIDFNKYHTYSWGQTKTPSVQWDERVRTVVDRELGQKGWNKVSAMGDAVVIAVITTKEDSSSHASSDQKVEWNWQAFPPGADRVVSREYKSGTLVVAIFDAGTRNLIWRGSSTSPVADTETANERVLDYVTTKVFKNFPPTPQ